MRTGEFRLTPAEAENEQLEKGTATTPGGDTRLALPESLLGRKALLESSSTEARYPVVSGSNSLCRGRMRIRAKAVAAR